MYGIIMSNLVGEVAIINLFKHRNLALGCTGFLIMLYLCYYISTALMIILGAVCIISIFSLWLSYFKTKNNRLFNLSLKLTPLFVLIIVAIIVSSLSFVQDKECLEYCDDNTHIIEGQVNEVIFAKNYFAGYTVTINKIDNKECSFKATLTDNSNSLVKNDTFTGAAAFFRLENQEIGFDTANYYLDDGILIGGEISEYTKIQSGKSDISDFFLKINSFLDGILKNKLNDETYPIASALLLGNRGLLPDNVTRDFTRLGIVHILSLSGMHVSIIVTMLGYAISKTNLSRITQIILILSLVTLFIGISGFSEPAIRAGVMQYIFYFVIFLWEKADTLTSLFVSITLICIFSPYLIFSLSLMLSFFSMLGCICSARILYKSKKICKVKSKLLRFIILTTGTTVSVTFISLPLTYIYFGTVSLASIPANILLIPILNIVIYLVPFILLFSPISFISDVLSYFCEVICRFVLYVCEYFADIKNISFSIKGNIQLIGVIIIFVSSLLILMLSKKQFKYILGILCAGMLVFIIGIIALNVDRNKNIYFTAYSLNGNDTVCIEQNNELTVIDISSYSLSMVYPYTMSNYLGYTEVENYIAMTYSHKLPSYLDKMTDSMILRNIYLPSPKNEIETEYFTKCAAVLNNKKIKFTMFDNELSVNEITLDICPDMFISRSAKRSVVFSASYDSFKYTYMGASSYELVSTLPDKYAYEADVIVFGKYGPVYKLSYKYHTPFLDYAIFIGSSEEYSQSEFLNNLDSRYSTKEPFAIRISK